MNYNYELKKLNDLEKQIKQKKANLELFKLLEERLDIKLDLSKDIDLEQVLIENGHSELVAIIEKYIMNRK